VRWEVVKLRKKGNAFLLREMVVALLGAVTFAACGERCHQD